MSAARVYLVGAGPGDPGLLTVRALDLIGCADVILHDRLIPSAALGRSRPDALVIDVGKQGGGASVPQSRTEDLLLEHARAGRTVVRLKGGDPFVFGRGGEEALALHAAGIPFEVVPGVTAGIAAAAYAGIPVTHRGLSSAVALVTGHERPDRGGDSLDWPALGAFPGTLVFYMGVGSLPEIAAALMSAGRSAQEPATIVERGTLPGQRTISGTLSDIAHRARAAEILAPSVTIVGAVGALAEDLHWLPELPLAGRSVAVTRARNQTSALARELASLGASVIEAPVIRIEELPGELPQLHRYDLICLTSPNGAEILFSRLRAAGRDARALAQTTVAAIGPGTARTLAGHGITADVVPERFVAEGLLDALADRSVSRALVVAPQTARTVLADGLRERGAEVDVLVLYRTVAEPLDNRTRAAAAAADYITFTSSSTVSHFLAAAGGPGALAPTTRIVSIGPITSAALREHGLEANVEAEEHDIDGLLAAMLTDARQ